MASGYESLYSHGFARVAAAVPRVRIADPGFNAERTLALARRAADEDAAVVVFPELGLSGYSIDDLFHQQALLDGVTAAIGSIVEASAELLARQGFTHDGTTLVDLFPHTAHVEAVTRFIREAPPRRTHR